MWFVTLLNFPWAVIIECCVFLSILFRPCFFLYLLLSITLGVVAGPRCGVLQQHGLVVLGSSLDIYSCN